MNFSHTKVVNSIQSNFGSEQNLGRYFADLLSNRLTADNVMHIIDRDGMNKVLFEPPSPVVASERPDSGFAQSGGLMNLGVRPDDSAPQMSSKVGLVLGVDPVVKFFEADALITGEVLTFGREDMRQKTLVDQVRLGLLKGCRKSRAIATINVRMINLNTGDLVTSAKLSATSHHASCNLLIAHGYTKPITDINDNNFSLTPLGEVLNQIAVMATEVLEHNSPQAPVYNPNQVNGEVADIEGSNITVNVGSVGGVHIGDMLIISHISRTVKDPESSKPIRVIENMVGQIEVTNVTPFYAVGRFSGGGTPAIKDLVRSSNPL
jgi:curli biogenesis system outer membrane secretion channel CsgG